MAPEDPRPTPENRGGNVERKELRIGIGCLTVGLMMLAVFYGIALLLGQGEATSLGGAGALLVGYWLLGPVGVILSVIGGLLSLVSWVSLRSS
jgi:amino acid permease